MSHELIPAVPQGMSVFDRITDPLAFVEAMGRSLAQAGVAGAKNEAQGKCLALACIAKRMDPFKFASLFHLIDGKPTLQAHVILARMRQVGYEQEWVKDGDDLTEAVATFTKNGKTSTIKFTMAEAKSQGIVKKDSAWDKTPAAMLRAALVRKAAKMLCPEVLIDDVDPIEFEGGPAEVGPAATHQRTPEEIAKRRAELQAEAAGTAVEAPPFETPPTPTAQPSNSANDLTTVLLEIEATIGQVGITKEQFEATLRQKNAEFAGLDSLSLEGAQKLLENLRAMLAAKK